MKGINLILYFVIVLIIVMWVFFIGYIQGYRYGTSESSLASKVCDVHNIDKLFDLTSRLVRDVVIKGNCFEGELEYTEYFLQSAEGNRWSAR